VTTLLAWAAGVVAVVVAALRWQLGRARRRAAAAEERDRAHARQLEVERTAAADVTAAATAGQEVEHATTPRTDDPTDPIEAAKARTARGEAAARLVRDQLDAARRAGRLR
jgi:hypothetical protein